jgi:hypothetical protein
LDSLAFVVISDIDFTFAVVAGIFLLGFVENRMKVKTAFAADPAAPEAFQHYRIGDVEVYDLIHNGKLR